MLLNAELIISLLIALGVGQYSKHVSPDYYIMITENGKEYNIKVDSNQKFACPIHCAADHYHNINITDNIEELDFYHYYIVEAESDKVYINNELISETIYVDKKKNSKPTKLKMFNVQAYLP